MFYGHSWIEPIIAGWRRAKAFGHACSGIETLTKEHKMIKPKVGETWTTEPGFLSPVTILEILDKDKNETRVYVAYVNAPHSNYVLWCSQLRVKVEAPVAESACDFNFDAFNDVLSHGSGMSPTMAKIIKRAVAAGRGEKQLAMQVGGLYRSANGLRILTFARSNQYQLIAVAGKMPAGRVLACVSSSMDTMSNYMMGKGYEFLGQIDSVTDLNAMLLPEGEK